MPWQLQFEGNHATIYGPGDLEIVLRDFRSVQARRGSVLPPTVRGLSVQRHWRYPLEEDLWLEGLSISKPEDLLERPELHMLHVGHSVYWRIPAEFAEELHALMETDETPISSGDKE